MTQFEYFRSSLLGSASSPIGVYLIASLLVLFLPFAFFRRRRRLLLAALIVIFAFSCTDFFARALLATLESFSPVSGQIDQDRPSVILVLSGGAIAEGGAYQPSVSSQRRLRRAIELKREFPNAELMLSGIESPILARWLRRNKSIADCLLETRSLNTAGNLRNSAAMLSRRFLDSTEKQESESASDTDSTDSDMSDTKENEKIRPQILLVTDRFHLARALLWARFCMSDFDVIPMPTPSLASRAPLNAVNFLPTIRGLQNTSMAWREFLALSRDMARTHWQ